MLTLIEYSQLIDKNNINHFKTVVTNEKQLNYYTDMLRSSEYSDIKISDIENPKNKPFYLSLDKLLFTIYNPGLYLDSNVIILTGLSRAGKTTFSKMFERSTGCARIKIDTFCNFISFGDKIILGGQDIAIEKTKSFLSERNINQFPVDCNRNELTNDFITSIIKSYNNSNEKLIIEGYPIIRNFRELSKIHIIDDKNIYQLFPIIVIDIDKDTQLKRLLNSKMYKNNIINNEKGDTNDEYLNEISRRFDSNKSLVDEFKEEMSNYESIHGDDLVSYLNL